MEIVKVLNQSEFLPPTNIAYFNLVNILHRTINQMHPKPAETYIKGHQEYSNRILDKQEYMNIVMDAKAKLALWESVQKGVNPQKGWLKSKVLLLVEIVRDRRSRFIASYLKR